jgi:hypothetical protein
MGFCARASMSSAPDEPLVQYTASMSLSVLGSQQAGGPLLSSISVFAKPDE